MSGPPPLREGQLVAAVRVWRVEYDRTGGPEVLVWREAALAAPGRGEVRVAVRAASVNPVDGKIRAGLLPPLPSAFPAGTGRDGAGLVVGLGADVDPVWLGRRVAFLAPRFGPGTWAEAVNLPVAVLAEIPETVNDLVAATLPLVGQSAEAVLAAGGVSLGADARGKRVLIHAAAGGVGRAAVQLAWLAGAEVHATASSARRPALEALGCARVWAYDEGEDFTALREVDLVIDLLGGAVHDRSYTVLRRGGIFACLKAAPFRDRGTEFDVQVVVAEVVPDGALLVRLLALVVAGRLDLGPERVLPATAFVEAQRLSDSGHAGGKIVLDFGAE